MRKRTVEARHRSGSGRENEQRSQSGAESVAGRRPGPGAPPRECTELHTLDSRALHGTYAFGFTSLEDCSVSARGTAWLMASHRPSGTAVHAAASAFASAITMPCCSRLSSEAVASIHLLDPPTPTTHLYRVLLSCTHIRLRSYTTVLALDTREQHARPKPCRTPDDHAISASCCQDFTLNVQSA